MYGRAQRLRCNGSTLPFRGHPAHGEVSAHFQPRERTTRSRSRTRPQLPSSSKPFLPISKVELFDFKSNHPRLRLGLPGKKLSTELSTAPSKPWGDALTDRTPLSNNYLHVMSIDFSYRSYFVEIICLCVTLTNKNRYFNSLRLTEDSCVASPICR